MTINIKFYDVKSTSLNGWEYLIVWEELGLSLMYAICVLFLIVYYLNNKLLDHDKW